MTIRTPATPPLALAIAAGLLCACAAHARPLGAFWVEVDNSAGNTPDMVGGDTTGTRTFDLFVQLEAGDVVYVADFGIAGPNDGLSTTQTVWQHPTGGDVATVNPQPFEANVVWDTHVALGDLTNLGQISTPVGPIDWDPAGFEGAWSASVGGQGFANPDNGNAMWLARITVSSAGAFGENTTALGEYLGGEFFVSGEGPNGQFPNSVAAKGVVSVGNAFIPTPGAMALFGLAGMAAVRRRR